MKIVIDIDNETYGRIQALVNADYFEHDICGYSIQRIANGTPYEDRPQGEWIDDKEYSHFANCSNCGYQMDTHEEHGYFNYCPHCGADMRGK